MICPGGETKTGGGLNQQRLSLGVKDAMAFEILGAHLAVEIHRGSPGKPRLLQAMGLADSGLDRRRGFPGLRGGEFVHLHCRHLKMDIDPVQQRAGKFAAIPLDLRGRAEAVLVRA